MRHPSVGKVESPVSKRSLRTCRGDIDASWLTRRNEETKIDALKNDAYLHQHFLFPPHITRFVSITKSNTTPCRDENFHFNNNKKRNYRGKKMDNRRF
jgi:hypothetical protein